MVQTTSGFPDAWSALGLQDSASPEALSAQLARLGYAIEIGVSSESPFGRQVVASGFGVLWQADYTKPTEGERLIGLSARRKR